MIMLKIDFGAYITLPCMFKFKCNIDAYLLTYIMWHRFLKIGDYLSKDENGNIQVN